MTKRTNDRAILTLLALTTLATPGCYTKVTNARGIGADAHYPERGRSDKPEIDKALDPILNPILNTEPE